MNLINRIKNWFNKPVKEHRCQCDKMNILGMKHKCNLQFTSSHEEDTVTILQFCPEDKNEMCGKCISYKGKELPDGNFSKSSGYCLSTKDRHFVWRDQWCKNFSPAGVWKYRQ